MEENKSLKDSLQMMLEKLANHTNTKTIFGEPIRTENKTIITVGKISYGVGGGSGGRCCSDKKQDNPVDHAKELNQGSGCGGGITVKPVGVIEISAEETRFIAFDMLKKLVLFMLIGILLGFILKRK